MIHREDHDSIAVLSLEHGKANAVDLELFEALDSRLGELERNPAGAVVITGRGSMFSAGVDLFRVLEEGEEYVGKFAPLIGSVLRRLYALEQPVVAAIGGHAIAGGCILAAACDLRVMAAGGAKIGVTELLVGVPFPAAALEVFRSLLPEHRAHRLVMGGRLLSPEEAWEAGLVDEVVPGEELMDRALAHAERFAAIPRPSFAVTKRQLRRPTLERIDELSPVLDPEVVRLWASPEVRAAMRAFLERTVSRKG